MTRSAAPPPGFLKRIGGIVDARRGVEFQELKSDSLLNRLTGSGMPFGWTVNPFRGCEVGCRYCYARPTHEYLGHTDPVDFEERIYVKIADKSRLLRDLKRARDTGQEVAIGAATDPYQPAESRFRITRRVLEAMVRVPGLRIGITTKCTGLVRDIDVLRELASGSDLRINVSLISLDHALLRLIEPRAPRPDLRLRAMRAVAEAGIRTRIFIMPVLPLLTDGEAGLRALLIAAREAGLRRRSPRPCFSAHPSPGISSSTSCAASFPGRCRGILSYFLDPARRRRECATASSGWSQRSLERPASRHGAGRPGSGTRHPPAPDSSPWSGSR